MFSHDLGGKRSDDVVDLLAVSGDHERVIVITVHHDVAKLGVGLISHLLSHLSTDFDEFVKDANVLFSFFANSFKGIR